jgi:hypothetical protein
MAPRLSAMTLDCSTPLWFMLKQFLVIVGITVGSVSCDASTEQAIFEFPASDRILAIERRPLHASLAEYRRTIILNRDRQPVARVAMFDDTGGYSRANLYRITDTIFLVRDAVASYTIDISKDTAVRDQQRRSAGSFVGTFDVDGSRTWRFISSRERAELRTEFRGG